MEFLTVNGELVKYNLCDLEEKESLMLNETDMLNISKIEKLMKGRISKSLYTFETVYNARLKTNIGLHFSRILDKEDLEDIYVSKLIYTQFKGTEEEIEKILKGFRISSDNRKNNIANIKFTTEFLNTDKYALSGFFVDGINTKLIHLMMKKPVHQITALLGLTDARKVKVKRYLIKK